MVYCPFSTANIMIWALNSEPLFLCNICGAPNSRNMSMSWYATSSARFDVSGRITTNFVRWSWYTIIHLKEPCGNDCISMRSTCPRAENTLDKIGRTTTPFVIGRTRLRWQSMHIDLNSSIESLVTLAYFLPNSFTIRSRPPWPVAMWAHLITSNVSSMCT